MMTFGLNRPVYSFGILVAASFFPDGSIRCAVDVEDLRVMEGAPRVPLEAEDLRDLSWYDPREVRVLEERMMLEGRVHHSQVIDVRIFEADFERLFVVEDDSRILIAELECEEDDV